MEGIARIPAYLYPNIFRMLPHYPPPRMSANSILIVFCIPASEFLFCNTTSALGKFSVRLIKSGPIGSLLSTFVETRPRIRFHENKYIPPRYCGYSGMQRGGGNGDTRASKRKKARWRTGNKVNIYYKYTLSHVRLLYPHNVATFFISLYALLLPFLVPQRFLIAPLYHNQSDHNHHNHHYKQRCYGIVNLYLYLGGFGTLGGRVPIGIYV